MRSIVSVIYPLNWKIKALRNVELLEFGETCTVLTNGLFYDMTHMATKIYNRECDRSSHLVEMITTKNAFKFIGYLKVKLYGHWCDQIYCDSWFFLSSLFQYIIYCGWSLLEFVSPKITWHSSYSEAYTVQL